MLKKKKKAAAIKYLKENLETPVIAALGSDKLAEKIIEQAKINNIEIIENKNFFDYEDFFRVGHEIPFEVYKIVANIITNIIKTNKVNYNVKKNTN